MIQSAYRWGRGLGENFVVEDEDAIAREIAKLGGSEASVERCFCTDQTGSSAVFELTNQFTGCICRVSAGEDAPCTDDAHEENWIEDIVRTEH